MLNCAIISLPVHATLDEPGREFIGLVFGNVRGNEYLGTVRFSLLAQPSMKKEAERIRQLSLHFSYEKPVEGAIVHRLSTREGHYYIRNEEIIEVSSHDGIAIDFEQLAKGNSFLFPKVRFVEFEFKWGGELVSFHGVVVEVNPTGNPEKFANPEKYLRKSEDFNEIGEAVRLILVSTAMSALHDRLQSALEFQPNELFAVGESIDESLFKGSEFSRTAIGDYETFYYSKDIESFESDLQRIERWIEQCPLVFENLARRIWIYSENEDYEPWLLDQSFPKGLKPRLFRDESSAWTPPSSLPSIFMVVSREGDLVWEWH